MPTPSSIIGEYLRRKIMNGMIESASIQDRRERGSGIHHPEDEPEEEEHSTLFLLAVELSRTDWQRIKAEKGD